MSRIFVCGLADMLDLAERLRPDRVISLLQPEWQPATPSGLAPEHHLRVEIHDITAPDPDQILPERAHVEQLIAFLEEARGQSLLIHCYAGISRSPAAALVAMVLDAPGREQEAALTLREAAPYAQPNRLLIELSDDRLGRGGHLVAALEAIGPASTAYPERRLLELPRSV